MVGFLGDIHGAFGRITEIAKRKLLGPGDTLIQVGDKGVQKRFLSPEWARLNLSFPFRVLFIDGNHEDYNVINGWSKTELTEVAPNTFYAPRGYVMEIEGKLFGFLGGAESVDKAWRVKSGPNRDWFWEERITDADVERLYANVGDRTLDYLVTHTPPIRAIHANFPPLDKASWQLDYGWIDFSSLAVQRVVDKIRPKNVVCGHMHKSVVYMQPFDTTSIKTDHCRIRILAIDELAGL